MTCPGQAQLAIANTAHAEALAIANTAHAEEGKGTAVEDGAAVEDDGKGKGRKGKDKGKGKGKRQGPYFYHRQQHRTNVFTHPRGFMEKLAVVFYLV